MQTAFNVRWAVVAAVIVTAFLAMAADANYDQGYSEGKQDAKSTLQEINSQGEIKGRVSNPITDNSAKMTTFGPDTAAPIDGTQCPKGYVFNAGSSICKKQQFAGQLVAPSSNVFLELLLGNNGSADLSIILLQQDLDYDDHFDYGFTFPNLVSGICVNGLISCDPGTWDNCRYFLWEADALNQVLLTETATIHALSACYCINNSCFAPLAGNLERALEDLGGGALAAIQGRDPHVAISHVETSAVQIRYYGQRTSDAGSGYPTPANVPYYDGSTNPSTYYTPTADTLTSPGTSESASQAGDPYSFYSMAVDNNANVVTAKESRRCVIKRAININPADLPVLDTTDTCAVLDTTGCSLESEQLCNYAGTDCVYSVEQYAATGLVPLNNSIARTSPNTGLVWTFNADGGQILHTDPAGATGVVSAGADHWWSVSRQYICNAAHDINTKNAPIVPPAGTYISWDGAQRTDHIVNNTSIAGSTVTYEDLDPDTGAITTSTIDIQINDPVVTCEKACKVRIDTKNTQAGMGGNAAEFRETTDSIEYEYRACDEDVCPVNAGDTIVQACTCLNEFPQAAATMKALEEAARDLICSGN